MLFEIGTEEIPAGYIQPALRFFEESAKTFRGTGPGVSARSGPWARPRRLTLAVRDLQEKQPDRVVEHIGPSKQAGFDAAGQSFQGGDGFAESPGEWRSKNLKVVETPKGEYLVAVEKVKGRATVELLPEVLAALVREMPFPKSMRWGRGNITFARPIQWLVALLDGKVIDLTIDEHAGRSNDQRSPVYGARDDIRRGCRSICQQAARAVCHG